MAISGEIRYVVGLNSRFLPHIILVLSLKRDFLWICLIIREVGVPIFRVKVHLSINSFSLSNDTVISAEDYSSMDGDWFVPLDCFPVLADKLCGALLYCSIACDVTAFYLKREPNILDHTEVIYSRQWISKSCMIAWYIAQKMRGGGEIA